MKPKKVREAVAEAERFLVRAKELLATESQCDWNPKEKFFPSTSGRQSGACRRSSLDLARALAAMRKT